MIGKKGQIGAFLVLIVIAGAFAGGIYYWDLTGDPMADQFYDFFSSFTGIPKDALKPPNIIYFVLLPYVTTVFIIFGIMMEIGIFRHVYAKTKEIIYIIIAATWAMLLLPTGILGAIAAFFYAGGALLAIIAFMALFVGGAFIWSRAGLRRIGGTHGALGELYNQRRNIQNKMTELSRKLSTDPNYTPDDFRKDIGKLKTRLKYVDDRIRAYREEVIPEKEPGEKVK